MIFIGVVMGMVAYWFFDKYLMPKMVELKDKWFK